LARNDKSYQLKRAQQKMRLVSRFIDTRTIFLEVGCGDGSFSQYVAKKVKKLYALDVSLEIVQKEKFSNNVQFILSEDGTSIPLEDESVDVVYSNQLMEHLHPDDALDQLKSIARVLSSDGAYICLTPNIISGPHDISQYFSDVAEGFHLKEYSWKELRALFIAVGFKKFKLYAGGLGWYVRVPECVVLSLENVLQRMPRGLGQKISRTLLCKAILGINVVAFK
jgi:SAM-dependent methyltransferase